jgi:hypothetical protein
MYLKRLVAVMLAVALTVSCIPCCWAEDVTPGQKEVSGGAVAGAVVTDILYIPGKLGVCIISTGVWTVTMLITTGVYYKEAGQIVYDTCGGKWVVTGEDMASLK